MITVDYLSAQDAADKISSLGGLFRMTMDRRPRRPEGSLTRLQGFLLLTVADREHMPMADLTQLLEVGPATASQFVSALEVRGWIERYLDPEDRRRHLVRVTKTGRAVAEETLKGRRLRIERILEHLSGEERTQLVSIAQRVADIVTSEPELLRRPLDVE